MAAEQTALPPAGGRAPPVAEGAEAGVVPLPRRRAPRLVGAAPLNGIRRPAAPRISEAAGRACAHAGSTVCRGQCGLAACRSAPLCAVSLVTPQAAVRSDSAPLAILSHELKHRLNLIQVSTELLINLPEVRLSGIAASVGATILRAVASQARIVDDLLDLSRARTGKLSLNSAGFSIGAMVAEIAESAAAQARLKGVLLECDADPACPPVQGDAVRTEQIIWNLVSNALKFTPSGERITLTLRAEAGFARLSVADTGRGIAPGFIGHVFEMFSQDKSHGEPGVGLGIGLSLVKELAEGQGGWVKAHSAGVGRGAVFDFGLPLLQGPRALAAPARARPLAGLRILAVDDCQDALEPFAELLALEGAQVKTANDAPAALALLDGGQFDLLLSDISMHGMSGDELLAEIRRRPYAALPAIALSGYGRGGAARQMRGGFDATITKPVDLGLLLRTITEVVGADRPHLLRA